MKKENLASLSVLILIVSSVFLLGAFGVYCELWSHIALSGSKRVGSKVLLRAVNQSNLIDIHFERSRIINHYLEPGL